MISLEGYQVSELIHEGTKTMAYRGHREEGQLPVVIKIHNTDYPSAGDIAKFKREYEIGTLFDTDGIIKYYTTLTYQNDLALISEDFSAVSLAELIPPEGMNVLTFLPVAVQMAGALRQVHGQNIIHKDIKARNVVVHPKTLETKLIDFGIASRLSREDQQALNPHTLEGTLSYISPEQTGRMNRSLDYRTDFYSLGVTFYQMLTGVLPFESGDAMGLVHAHMAVLPKPAHGRKRGVPKILSAIVMKLMAKNAEDRYQSALGLQDDLHRCATELEEQGNLVDFEFLLGENDTTGTLKIPQKLYGREKEIETVLQIFNRISGGDKGLVLITGAPGVGKSALIREVHKPITEKRGSFIEGKFDQLKRNIPYSALTQAFNQWCQYLLTEPDEIREEWKTRIIDAVGDNGQVVVDIVPDLEQVIGSQPSVPDLPGIENQNRLRYVFASFISALPNQEHPLVLFLDDLQWVDAATLSLLELITLEDRVRYLLVLGAYRDNEVDDAHPLVQTVKNISGAQAVQSIQVTPLPPSAVEALVADTFHGTDGSQLAQQVHAKTEGNPFFVGEFLRHLKAENLVRFEVNSRRWTWEARAISAAQITNNVVELLLEKIRRLDEIAQEMLMYGACLGAEFTLSDLVRLPLEAFKDESQLNRTAIQLVNEGFLVQVIRDESYRFVHDRVQQAGYALLNETARAQAHYQVGHAILDNSSESDQEERIFEITDHLNQAAALLDGQSEKTSLARLNLRAGRRARQSTAYEAAVGYFETGLALLPEERWDSEYDLTLSLHNAAAEAVFLTGEYDQVDEYTRLVVAHAHTALEKVDVYESQVLSSASQQKFAHAIQTGRAALAELGVHLPKDPKIYHVLIGFVKVKLVLRGRSIPSLYDLPEMTDPVQLAVGRLFDAMALPVYTAQPLLFPIMAFMGIRKFVRYGNSPMAAFFYSAYGTVLSAQQDIDDAYQAGQLALRLADKPEARPIKGRTITVVGDMTHYLKNSLRDTVAIMRASVDIPLEVGDIQFGALIVSNSYMESFVAGERLGQLEKDGDWAAKVTNRLKEETSYLEVEIVRQTVSHLRDGTGDIRVLVGEHFDETRIVTELEGANNHSVLCLLYNYKMMMQCLQCEPALALESSDNVFKYIDALQGTFMVPNTLFYDCLIRLALFPTTSQKKAFLKQIKRQQTKLRKWAQHAPMNYQHKVDLIEAERARVLGKPLQAAQFYDKAVAGARENKFIHEEALANELAAKFYLEIDREKIAAVYMTDARYLYERWGATAKVGQLDEKYPHLLRRALGDTEGRADAAITSFTSESSSTSEAGTLALDLSTLMKASHTLSGEIVLENLLEKMMRIVIENTGAGRGVLIFAKDGQFFIEAEAAIDADEVRVLHSIPVTGSGKICQGIVNFVINTGEGVVLADAANEGQFVSDPYIVENQIKSILCEPLINQGQLRGLVYLENNLTTAAFSPDRIQVLNLLSSQAAISIDNANLYQDLQTLNAQLEGRVEERTGELRLAKEEAEVANKAKDENLENFKFALMAAEAGRWFLDLVHNKNEWDERALEIYGVSKENFDFTYEAWRELVHPDDIEREERHFSEMIKIGSRYTSRHRAIKQNGDIVHVLSQAIFKKNADGEIVGALGVVFDITESVLREQDLKAAKEAAEQAKETAEVANQSKSTFLANMSHEIRTPMNAILGFTEILTELVEDHQQKEYLSAVQSSGKSLLGLINDILDLSKVEAGKLELEYSAVSPQTVFAEMEQIFSQKVSQKGLEFIVDIDPDLPRALVLDETRLRQLLLNLVGNAVKFTDSGHIKLSARSRYPEKDRSTLDLIFEVEDTGIGIPEDQIDSIFAAFEQQEGQIHAQYGGTGLGLAITKRLIEMMGGEIYVTSETGKGSIFHVTLKSVTVASLSDLGGKEEAQIDVGWVTFEPATILVADDVEVNRNLIKGYLEGYDFNFLKAANGEEAVELVGQHHPDLVLMDIKMPVMDGYEATARIKEDDEVKDIPIVALTASVMKEREDEIRERCDGFLRKPVGKAELVAELTRFLQHTLERPTSVTSESNLPEPGELESQSLSSETIDKLPELVRTLEEEKGMWEELQATQTINDIEDFAARMVEVGGDYGYPPLVSWGERLGSQARMFDLDAMSKTLDKYPDLIEEIGAISKT